MKNHYALLVAIFSFFLTHAQATITNETIANNKVKTITKKDFDNNSEEGCNTITTTYDRNGNIIIWNWERIGSFFEYEYDEKNRKIAMIRKSKYDSTDVHIMKTTYDKLDNIVSDYSNKFQNFYDEKNRLIKSVTLDKEGILSETFKIYKYDALDNLIKEVHYQDSEVENTILYEYDTFCRLIEKREYDTERIEFWNEEYAQYKKPITYFLTNISYDEKGKIKEKYDYFSDPCESMDDHFTFKYVYKPNDLLQKVDVFAKEKLVFSISFEYTFY